MAGVWFLLDMCIFYSILSFLTYPSHQPSILVLHFLKPYIHNRTQKFSLKPYTIK